MAALASSALVRAADVVCDACERAAGGAETSERVTLCFVREGLFERRVGSRPGSRTGVAAPGDALVFAPGADYRVAHPLALEPALELAALAAELELSPWHVSRAFRAATGTTLSARHERLRLGAASERLLDGERDLTGLALALGFCDHAHLTRRFRAVLGVAPSQVRNRIQAPPRAPR